MRFGNNTSKRSASGISFFSKGFLSFLIVGVMLIAGCTLKIPMSRPAPSSFMYSGTTSEPVRVVVRDFRPVGEESLTQGRVHVAILNLDNPVAAIGEDLVKELKARGINAVIGTDASAVSDTLVLDIDKFFFRNHRATGYSPYITFTNFRATAYYNGMKEVVTSYYHAGKVPIMSMGEVVEPTYNYPLSVVIKEVATKLNSRFFKLNTPEDVVSEKIRVSGSNQDCASIMELAFTGSETALPHLEKLVNEGKGNTVKCALNAIGIIGKPGSFNFLRNVYETSDGQAILMALKAIGDLGTPEALDYVRGLPGNIHYNLKEVVSLYTY